LGVTPAKWDKKVCRLIDRVSGSPEAKDVKAFGKLIAYHKMHFTKNDSNLEIALQHIGRIGRPVKFLHLLNTEGVNTAFQDGSGNTALMWAIANAQNSMAMELQQYCDVDGLNKQCTSGNTALHLAVGKGYTDISADGQLLDFTNFEITKKLIEHGANLNLQNEQGNTPLHLAYARRDIAIALYLYEHGANPDIKNKQGKIPLDLLTLSHHEATDLIEETVVVFAPISTL